jgi:proteasome alpha subunit
MSEIGGVSSSSNSNNRYPYYYGPEGRLVLVDSALEAVSRGSTTIGIKTPKFALISSHIKPTKALVILQLIDEMRIASQRHRLSYESPIDVNSLAKYLGAYLHNYTIYAVRPQAASIIISGMDQMGIQLYQVDPSGTYFRGSEGLDLLSAITQI